jgi:hypothetical protein
MCGPYRVLVKVEQVMIYQLSPLRSKQIQIFCFGTQDAGGLNGYRTLFKMDMHLCGDAQAKDGLPSAHKQSNSSLTYSSGRPQSQSPTDRIRSLANKGGWAEAHPTPQ